jgi:hypothetical protein
LVIQKALIDHLEGDLITVQDFKVRMEAILPKEFFVIPKLLPPFLQYSSYSKPTQVAPITIAYQPNADSDFLSPPPDSDSQTSNMIIDNTQFTAVTNKKEKDQQDLLQRQSCHSSNDAPFHHHQSLLPQPLEPIILVPHPPKSVFHLHTPPISQILLQAHCPHQT